VIESVYGLSSVGHPTTEANPEESFDQVLFGEEVIEIELDLSFIAPCDKCHASPVGSDVELEDDGADKVLQLWKSLVVDASRSIQKKNQVDVVERRCEKT
jgi:hypothetical protein